MPISPDSPSDERRTQFLLALSSAVRSLTEPSEIADTVTELIGKHFGVDRTGYAVVEPDQETIVTTHEWRRPGMTSLRGQLRISDYGPVVGPKLRAGLPYLLIDANTDSDTAAHREAYAAIQVRSALVIPLLKGDRLLALLGLNSNAPKLWTPEEVDLAEIAVNILWEALERAQATQISQEGEERFRALADNIAQLAWMADEKGWIFWYNQRWYDYTGTNFEQMQGWGWKLVQHPDHSERIVEKWAAHLNTLEKWEETFPLRRADGQYRWFLTQAFPILGVNGEVVRWCGTNTDVTEQREAAEALARAKEEAEAASRAKDAFLAALSHELRTPLTPVLMAAAALGEEERLPEDVRETLHMIKRNIELEARLIDDLLDVTRITSGKLPLRMERCDAHSLLELALEVVRSEADAKSCSIILTLAAEHTALLGDAARLQQVFWNLLKNAIKFTPRQGRITVRSQSNGPLLTVEVNDTGIGIAPEALEYIFEPFEQAGRTNDHRFGGLGLGLSISRTIVEMHHGKITAESAGADQGATFRVELPLVDPLPEIVSIRSLPVQPHPAAPPALRLLVVEDHEPTLSVLSRLLSRAGHTVSTAGSVTAALERASSFQFDAIVSDIGLPDGTGYDLMRALHEAHGLRGIALSGYGTEQDIKRSLDAGFISHLVKPVNFEQLNRALAQFTPRSLDKS